jgi:hypothetical protein
VKGKELDAQAGGGHDHPAGRGVAGALTHLGTYTPWSPQMEAWSGAPIPSKATKWPRWSMPLYLFLATLPCDVLSAFLAFSDRLVYPAYALGPRHAGMTALQDQVSAGALPLLFACLIADPV